MHRLVMLLLIVWLVLLAGAMLWWGLPLLYAWPQSGLGEYIEPQQGYQRGKTLWDWLELLIVPVILALAAVWFNHSEKQNEMTAAEKRAQTEREVAQDNLRESALQGYFDRMSDLLLNKNLHEPEEGSEVRAIARSRTLATLRQLDSSRKGSLVRFLKESGLIYREHPLISLIEADLHGAFLRGANLVGADLNGTNLFGADLRGANLVEAHLIGVDLRGADLREAILVGAVLGGAFLGGADLGGANLARTNLGVADLRGANLARANLGVAFLHRANLSGANLSGADLSGADLSGADLSGADLSGADLSGADLSGADLSGTRVTKEQLDRVASLQGATLPDGTEVPYDEGEPQPAAGNGAESEGE